MAILIKLKDIAKVTMLEKYAGQVVVAGIPMLLSWNSLTTYQNALSLRDISVSIRVYGETLATVAGTITGLDNEIRLVEKRVSKIENTNWSAENQYAFKLWVEEELFKKVNK
jgi:hypothetical protein